MTKRNLQKFSKIGLLNILSAFALIGCAAKEDSTDFYTWQPSESGPTYEIPSVSVPVVQTNSSPARSPLLTQVKELESELREYGVQFEVNESQNKPTYESNYRTERTTIEVGIKRNRSTDDDLIAIGKSIEDRDKIFVRMSDLWTIVDANSFQNDTSDKELIIAVLKISIVRTQVMLPRFSQVLREMFALLSPNDVVNLDKDAGFGLTLWRDNGDLLTNGEAVNLISQRIAKNQQLEGLKVTFLGQYLKDLKRNRDLKIFPGEKSAFDTQIDNISNALELKFLNDEDEMKLSDLKKVLSDRNPNDPVDVKPLKQANRAVLNAKREQLITIIDTRVKDIMTMLDVSFTTVGGKIAIDQKSVSRAKVRGTYDGRPAGHNAVVKMQSEYKAFLGHFGTRSDAPKNEAEILKKLDLFLTL